MVPRNLNGPLLVIRYACANNLSQHEPVDLVSAIVE
ncbi:hypothetical protein M7I_1412 [Glarea lozoyensis 74030]|uniref:Uncharacterized protein n=1 Tax=Glarea lozoyensis (strain ATCC 74030 / MF5533) TaxID=1104152 RepID=H0EG04_GLAL7|nr:hypothetical protein M7I_1412 [Glarea lozoyensis 74030]